MTLTYLCDECGLEVPAVDARLDQDGTARCPRCEWPLSQTRPAPTVAPAALLPNQCEECGLVVAKDSVRRADDGQALCPRCEWPIQLA